MWKEYAYKENIHPAIISYLGIKGQYFSHIETTVEWKAVCHAQGLGGSVTVPWSMKLGKRADRDVIGQYIQHPRIAKKVLPIIWSFIINIRMSTRWIDRS